MCAIIFATQNLDPLWITGLDPFANLGEGKCIFDGEVIPAFIGCSESGSITSEFLAARKLMKQTYSNNW
jgi:hypothetical protein